jgi:hypothetical protein
MKDNARILFDGLMLFCFSRKTTKRKPDRRSRCEIGLLNRTGNDEHEFVINVEIEQLRGGNLVKVAPELIGMRANPLRISQSDLRKFSSLFLYTGNTHQPPPKSGSVIREKSFDTVLDLEGEDFYRGKLEFVPSNYTKLISTTGSFAGVDHTGDAQFARVSKKILDLILSTFQRPKDWALLLDPNKRLLASFSRKVESVIEITKGRNLVLKGSRKSGRQEIIFSLPHPSILKAKRYVIEITNHDLEHPSTHMDGDVVIKNCAAFAHYSSAIKSIQINGKSRSFKSSSRSSKPIYGLTRNFDYTDSNNAGSNLNLQRSKDACCIACQTSQSDNIS